MAARVDVTGHRYGRLTMIQRHHVDASNRWHWLAECDCGNDTVVLLYNCRSGRTRSCGCIRRETCAQTGRAAATHGQAGHSTRTATYRAWVALNSRCTNTKSPNWERYGGRGITVCERWRTSFENFLADMGERPAAHLSLDRINNDGNYEPGNCRWATIKEQRNNRRPPKHGNARDGKASPEYRAWAAALHKARKSGAPADAALTDFRTFLQMVGAKPSRAHRLYVIEPAAGFVADNFEWRRSTRIRRTKAFPELQMEASL